MTQLNSRINEWSWISNLSHLSYLSSAEKTPTGYFSSKSAQVGKIVKNSTKEKSKQDFDYPNLSQETLMSNSRLFVKDLKQKIEEPFVNTQNNADNYNEIFGANITYSDQDWSLNDFHKNKIEKSWYNSYNEYSQLSNSSSNIGSDNNNNKIESAFVEKSQSPNICISKELKIIDDNLELPPKNKCNLKIGMSPYAAVFEPAKYNNTNKSMSFKQNSHHSEINKNERTRLVNGESDQILQELNLMFPRGPYGPFTANVNVSEITARPGYPHYEFLPSANTWLPGEGHKFQSKNYMYQLKRPIYMGMNGHVYDCIRKCVKSQDQQESQVIAKVVPNTSAFEREIIILKELQDCSNIIKLKDILEERLYLVSIMELAQTDAHNFFAGHVPKKYGWCLDKTSIREYFARMIVNDVVHGLKQMHKLHYLHCDLKAQNILMFIWRSSQKGSYIQAKLTDFGHSWKGITRIAEEPLSNGMARIGTCGHVAPELFVKGSACGPKVDIWSLGIVMFSMLVPGHLLFGEYSSYLELQDAYNKINKNNPYSYNDVNTPSWFHKFQMCSPEARDLILWMTRFDPEERPDEDQILEHPWFHVHKKVQNVIGYKNKLKYWSAMGTYCSIAHE